MIKLLITSTLALLASSAYAEPSNIRVLHSGTSQNGYHYFITAREASHVLGQKFQVELRYSCDNSKHTHEALEAPVQDSFSVCDLDPNSIKLNLQKSAMALKVKAAVLYSYYDQVGQGLESPILYCETKTQVRSFSLKQICN